jgi:hypothetical protein
MTATAPSPHALVLQVATDHFLPRCLHVVAELGVADKLGDAPMSADALASATGLNADVLGRMLRLLATAGIFEPRGPLWAHTALSRIVRSDHPQSLRPYIRQIGGRMVWHALGELEHAARTGRSVADRFMPGGAWAHFRDHPDAARTFDAAMTARWSGEIAALLPAFDFGRYRVIADVGGGRGHVLCAVLDAAPNASGILFDLPTVVADVGPHPRMTTRGGDFFKDLLPTADAYILGHILHDWADQEATALLRAIRRAMPEHANLLVLESIVPDGPEPHPSKVSDLVMLAFTNGRERTRREYEALLAAGGFRLDRVVPTACATSIIVGVPA